MTWLATGTLGTFQIRDDRFKKEAEPGGTVRIPDDRFKKGLSREGHSRFEMTDSRTGVGLEPGDPLCRPKRGPARGGDTAGDGDAGEIPDSRWQIQEGG